LKRNSSNRKDAVLILKPAIPAHMMDLQSWFFGELVHLFKLAATTTVFFIQKSAIPSGAFTHTQIMTDKTAG
jgi:hypothetical protein